ncbi:transcription antitermination factor NusB [Solemya velum gill symbiont]|uniref:Transcription antitermination protein NusB n=1 Tax=Solemya velum gill symbiont TaxID=2340 RepID=A0A0B0HBC6_SOVGS|nr:transcription antitermination factor NusB [Solemya velum gill symbiont]KHF25947.1 transcription antitermination factor NusB [Solemya velum gill symbiont]OOY34462.1 N utilization substance protein B [Solemya velum gill symbiont]OOY37174.1 N utilization substance protein B [Solemya velum gill symbiont]OOY41188.1 N utilization substance protein B [Solemya velum gill symbiont]OOY43187.1 N utilization substance protein B [Solemya velum gill symbiont]
MSNKRHKARQLAMQGLYQWQVNEQNVAEIINQFLGDEDMGTFDVPYFRDLLAGVPSHLDSIDEKIKPLINRSIEQVDPVERAILRLGVYEMMQHPEIPFRVVINEGVELAKTYGADQGHRYINGVLDKLAPELRPFEAKKK